MASKRLLLAAGGTGGHMFPAQALAEHLSFEGWEVALITDARGKKHAGAIPADPIREVSAATINPKRPIAAIKGMLKLANGINEAKSFMRGWKPDVVAGFGGYPAFPAVKAAQALKIPTVLHEQNAVLGRVNRALAKEADVIATGFPRCDKVPAGARTVFTGNPLRAQINAAIPAEYTVPGDRIFLTIVGGSLGAKLISETVPAAVALLPTEMQKNLSVVQQTRRENLTEAREIYRLAGVDALCEPFFSDIEMHLAAAHFIIGRAGASSVSEIAAMGKPSLLVPLKIAMDNHQTINALALKDLGAADILPESEFTAEGVKTTLMERLNDSTWLETASRNARRAAPTDATAALADLVINAARKDTTQS
jgi:UDP-N-acetylglucosamine--N-acetylmuramyl-(pentapeptide) pyrophosphoryl-undecaprenol N-acetylglucosamine transferase